MSEPSNLYFHVIHENLFTFSFECVQRRMMTFREDSVKLHWDALKACLMFLKLIYSVWVCQYHYLT